MFFEEALGPLGFELFGIEFGPQDLVPGLRPGVVGAEFGGELVGDDAFAGVEPVEFGPELFRRSGFGDAEFAGADVEAGQCAAVAPGDEGRKIVVTGRIEQRVVDDRARGDDAGHLPLDDSLRQFGILHLLCDGDLDAGRDQPGEVIFQRVVGEAAHRHPLPLGEGKFEHRTHPFRVFEKLLVEVAEPEEQHRVRRDRRLRLAVLPHHRSEVFFHPAPVPSIPSHTCRFR